MTTRDETLTAIGNAIQAYAALEFKLFQVVKTLLGVEADKAAAVFYSLRNSRDRNSILKHLLRIVHGDKHVAFWKSIAGHVKKLDDQRNRIVHGLLVVNDAADLPDYYLTRPESYWVEEWPVGEVLTHADILAFTEKTQAISELIQQFIWYRVGGMGRDEQFAARWVPIFDQKVEYPLPPGHPYYD